MMQLLNWNILLPQPYEVEKALSNYFYIAVKFYAQNCQSLNEYCVSRALEAAEYDDLFWQDQKG